MDVKPGTTAIFLCKGARPEDEALPKTQEKERKSVLKGSTELLTQTDT